jgi:hypothetical protein
MANSRPKVILRIGSHAEKEYFKNFATKLDGLLFGGNLLEITPAATCSLILQLRTKAKTRQVPFYIDPMTYCFGAYVDLETDRIRTDLDALKSDQLEKRGDPTRVRRVKESYSSLSNELGTAFQVAVGDGRSCSALDPAQLSRGEQIKLCTGVVKYQLERITNILNEDEFLKNALGDTIKPAAVFAPYFYVHDKWASAGITTALQLASITAELKPGVPVHAILCTTRSVLRSSSVISQLSRELPKTGIAGIWLWIDGLDEVNDPSFDDLTALRTLVRAMKGKLEVVNLHGGYFSMLLCHDGMTGISHGVGYGEQKQVAQIIGPAAPAVRYYLPPIAKRVGVPDVQRSFEEAKVRSVADFHARVCDCSVCKRVLSAGLARFSSFGEMYRASPTSQKDTQTPVAAKLCRNHFLLNRFREREEIEQLTLVDRANHLTKKSAIWRDCFPLSRYLEVSGGGNYIDLWKRVLQAP